MQVIICESSGAWAAVLRPRLPAGQKLIETRLLDHVWEQFSVAPAATIALELTVARAQGIVAFLQRQRHEHPAAAVVVLAERSLAGWEPLMREAGAIHFLNSPRRLDEVVSLIRRRAAFAAESHFPTDAPPLSLEEQIMAGLPWGT